MDRVNRVALGGGSFKDRNPRARRQVVLQRAAVEALESRRYLTEVENPWPLGYTQTGGSMEGDWITFDLDFAESPYGVPGLIQVDSGAGWSSGFENGIDFGPDGTIAHLTAYMADHLGGNQLTISINAADTEVWHFDPGITGIAPTGTLNSSGPINEGGTVTVSFSDPYDPSPADTSAGFTYVFTDDPYGLVYETPSSNPSATFTFTDDGPKTIWARIFDKDGLFNTVDTTVAVANVAPFATLTFSDPDSSGNVTVSLDNAHDPSSDDTIAGFKYAFNVVYNNLPGSYSGAGSGTSAVFSSSQLPVGGIVFARIFDQDNGARNYALGYTDMSVAAAGPHQYNLTWTDNLPNEYGWRVQWSDDGSFGEGHVGYVNLAADTNHYEAINVPDGMRQWFRVRAYSGEGYTSESIYSPKMAATTPILPPTDLAAAEVHADSVVLEWTPQSVYEMGFLLQTKIGNGSWDAGVTLDPGTTWYEVTDLDPLHPYHFKITTLGEDIDSDHESLETPSPVIDVTTRPPQPVLDDLVLQIGAEPGVIIHGVADLPSGWGNWTDRTIVLEMSIDGEAFDSAGEMDWDEETIEFPVAFWELAAELEGTLITFRIYVTGNGIQSDYSHEITVAMPPFGPNGLQASSSDADSITLSLSDTSSHEEGFELVVTPADGSEPWTILLDANTTTYTVEGLDEGMEYFFEAWAFANGEISEPIEATARTTLAAPDNLAADAVNPFEINLTWDDNSEVEDGYLVTWVDEDGEHPFDPEEDPLAESVVLPPNTTGYPFIGLYPEHEYHFEVVAFVDRVFNEEPVRVFSEADEASETTPEDTSDDPRPEPGKAPPPPVYGIGTLYRFSFSGSPQTSASVFANTGELVFSGPTQWTHGTPPDITAGYMNSTISGTITSENLNWAPTAYFVYPGPAFTDIAHSTSHGEIRMEDTYGRDMAANAHDGEWHLLRETMTIDENDPNSTSGPVEPEEGEDPLPYVYMEVIDGEGAEEDEDAITFRVSRWQYDLSDPLTVFLFDPAGTAGEDDYETEIRNSSDSVIGSAGPGLPGSVTIPAGDEYVTVRIIPVDDDDYEEAETVVAILKASDTYWLTTALMAEGQIADNDSQVISVEWDAVPATPLDTNPNAGGGKRIFPDKISPTDTTPHDLVDVVATVWPIPPTGTTVFFKAFDVDDPSQSVMTIVDSNDTMGAPQGFDNRGTTPNKRGVFPTSGVQTVSGQTDANGKVRVSFKVTTQPGDNFRIAASLNQSELARIGDEQSAMIRQVLPGNAQLPVRYDLRLTEMLTVWRRLWVERDQMTGVTALAIPVTITNVTTVGNYDIVKLNARLEDGRNAFSGGTLTIPAVTGFAGKTLRVYLNSDNLVSGDTLTVAAGSFTAGDKAFIAATPVAGTLDDDDVIPAGGTMALPSGGNNVVTPYGTTGDFISNAFGTAYVLPLYVDPGAGSWNTVGTVPMVNGTNDYRHLTDRRDGIAYNAGALKNRDLVSTGLFWTTLVVGAFENYASTDGDPYFDPGATGANVPSGKTVGSDDKIDYGLSDPTGFDQNRSAIFLETIRDVGYPSVEAVVTHEIGHTAGTGFDHTETGLLMQTGFGGKTQFDESWLYFVRGLGTW